MKRIAAMLLAVLMLRGALGCRDTGAPATEAHPSSRAASKRMMIRFTVLTPPYTGSQNTIPHRSRRSGICLHRSSRRNIDRTPA